MLWGAMNNASTAMMATSVDMGSISQNISNVNTTGYKRTETMFSTLLSGSHAAPNAYSGGLNIFGVQATQRNHIQAQGVITPSTTWSDLAINGKGFFMVAPPAYGTTGVPETISTADPGSVLYTRDGSWRRTSGPDTDPTLSRSYFTTGGGNYLLGWMADNTGAVDTSATLEPVYTLAPRPIANNGTAAVDETTTLNPTAVTMPGRATTELSVLANLPSDSRMGGTQSTVTVNDGLGNPQTVTLNWTRSAADSWTVTASTPFATLSTNSWTVTVDDTGAVTSPIGPQAVDFTWDAAHGNATVASTVDPSSAIVSRGELQKIPVQVYDSNFEGHTVTLGFERIGTNTWYAFIDPGPGGTGSAPMRIEFDNNGQLISPAGGHISVSGSWTSGTPPVTSTATVDIDGSKITQYSDSSLYIGNVDQDGYGRGTLMATSFNEIGELNGYYNNGQSRILFKVPVANFVAENSLDPVSGNLFRRTAEAGDLVVSGIDEAEGEGRFATSSLETSTVDIGEEFTRMIMTQKAYSTNAQVFKTADEMTTTARDLKT